MKVFAYLSLPTATIMSLKQKTIGGSNIILEPLLSFVRFFERFLGPEDDWVEEDRRILFEAAQRHLGHLHTFIKEKGPEEYLTTVKVSPDRFEEIIAPPYNRNVASNRKYRTYHGGGKQWAVGSFVIDPKDTRWQHHVYIFETEDGYTDVHSHTETSVRYGWDHLEEEQDDATPYIIFDILDRADVEYEDRGY